MSLLSIFFVVNPVFAQADKDDDGRKPEKKINWIKIEAGFNLILPIVLILGILLPRVEYRTESDFYIGFILFGIVSVISYYWAIRYYLLINKIDFKNSITSGLNPVNFGIFIPQNLSFGQDEA